MLEGELAHQASMNPGRDDAAIQGEPSKKYLLTLLAISQIPAAAFIPTAPQLAFTASILSLILCFSSLSCLRPIIISSSSSRGSIPMGRSSGRSSSSSSRRDSDEEVGAGGICWRRMARTGWGEYAIPGWRILISMMLVKRPRGGDDSDHASRKKSRPNSSDAPSLLDLPDLVLDAILGQLPAESLLRMSGVCRELRSRCRGGFFWEALVYEKWGRLAGMGAFREWRRKQEEESKRCCGRNSRHWVWHLGCFWPFSRCIALLRRAKRGPPMDSLMAWYWALETGSFWFPAQVYNREYGHVGFLLSCYDAELSYCRSSDSFRARYPPHGPRALVMEDKIPWQRLRAPAVETPADALHPSDCLVELKPGDHIEVQWRRNKEFPYGWWYGVVGHSEECNSRDCRHCSCQSDSTVWLVFNQYTSGSRWKRAAIIRSNHSETGNETDGFYGGVRKLRTKDEISVWESLWPVDILE